MGKTRPRAIRSGRGAPPDGRGEKVGTPVFTADPSCHAGMAIASGDLAADPDPDGNRRGVGRFRPNPARLRRRDAEPRAGQVLREGSPPLAGGELPEVPRP